MEETLRLIKTKLPHGWTTTLHKSTKLSVSTIEKVMRGERQNPKVLKAAILLAKKNSSEQDELNKLLKKLKK